MSKFYNSCRKAAEDTTGEILDIHINPQTSNQKSPKNNAITGEINNKEEINGNEGI